MDYKSHGFIETLEDPLIFMIIHFLSSPKFKRYRIVFHNPTKICNDTVVATTPLVLWLYKEVPA